MNQAEMDMGRIAALREVRREKARLSYAENRLARPQLKNLDIMEDMVGVYRGWSEEAGVSSTMRRRAFVLVVLFLFAPSVLAGGKMPNGLRRRMARLLGVSSDEVLSADAKIAVRHYALYADSREAARSLYRKLENFLTQQQMS